MRTLSYQMRLTPASHPQEELSYLHTHVGDSGARCAFKYGMSSLTLLWKANQGSRRAVFSQVLSRLLLCHGAALSNNVSTSQS